MQSLRHIIERSPDQDPQRPVTGLAGLADDPFRPLGRLSESFVAGQSPPSLFAQQPQRIGMHDGRMASQPEIIRLIQIYHPQDLLFRTVAERRGGDQPLQFEPVAVHQQMNHRLIVVGIRPPDIRADQHTGFRKRGSGLNLCRCRFRSGPYSGYCKNDRKTNDTLSHTEPVDKTESHNLTAILATICHFTLIGFRPLPDETSQRAAAFANLPLP